MMNVFANIRAFLLLSVFVIVAFNVVAQKLPSKQEGSVRAPEKVKIDGKATEWTFKAYNVATDVFYTMAHDNDNIYLVIKAADESSVRKIISSGITFSVNSIAKKTDALGAVVTYPLFNYKNKPNINFLVRSAPADSADYIVTANNKQFTSMGKFVRVRGIKDVDTLLSVYNTDGISVASSFDKEGGYTYELAISRKHIAPFVDAQGRFFYTVVLNGLKMDDMPGIEVKRGGDGVIKEVHIRKELYRPNLSQGMNINTDFSGEYILTK
jgi:hypothetical protein